MKKYLLFLIFLGLFSSNLHAQNISEFVNTFNTKLSQQFPSSKAEFEGSVISIYMSTVDIANNNTMVTSDQMDDYISNKDTNKEFSEVFLNSFISSMGDLKSVKDLGVSAFKIYFIMSDGKEVYAGMRKI